MLTPKFTKKDIENFLKQKLVQYESAILSSMQYVGEEFVSNARSKTAEQGSFKDHTGNLRSSIGYVILKNGKVVFETFPGLKSEAVVIAKKVAQLAMKKFKGVKGFVLIGIAGMGYAAAVESKGKDVITGSSVIAKESLERAVKKLLKK